MNEIAPWPPVKDNKPNRRHPTPEWMLCPHLSWFGLTYGWYWIDVGQTSLFRYSQEYVDMAKRTYSDAPWLKEFADFPFVDYQVARLWEDVLDILPAVLEPVPPRFARWLEGPWMEWVQQLDAAMDAQNRDMRWGLLYDATRWWECRNLDSAYLVSGPNTYFWNDGNNLHIHWDNRNCFIEGVPAWEAPFGEVIMPIDAFLEEVRTFDTQLIKRMQDRTAIAQANWIWPDVALDPNLASEQVVRAQRLSQATEAKPLHKAIDWNSAVHAIAQIEAHPSIAPNIKIHLL